MHLVPVGCDQRANRLARQLFLAHGTCAEHDAIAGNFRVVPAGGAVGGRSVGEEDAIEKTETLRIG